MAKSGWFTSKEKIKEEEKEERERVLAQRRAAAQQKLVNHVRKLCADPRFTVTTFDGLNWIHPYNGTIVHCPFDLEQTIHKSLMRHQPWKSGNDPLPLQKLQQIAWIQFLMQSISEDDRLKNMSGTNWLNPFTGEWIANVPLDAHGKMHGPSLLYISKFLNGDPRSEKREFMDSRALQKCIANRPSNEHSGVQNIFSREEGFLEDDSGLHLNIDNLASETQQREQTSSSFHIAEINPGLSEIHNDSSITTAVAPSSDPDVNAQNVQDKLAAQAAIQQTGEHEFDLARAKEIQAQSCGKLPEDRNFEIAVLYEGYSQVSGDFYTVIKLTETKYFMILGDVSGHGVQAALVVAGAIRTLRLLAKRCHDLVDLIAELNDEIKPEILSSQFITAFAGIYDTSCNQMTFILAGHHKCLLTNMQSALGLECVGERGMAIGLLKGPMFRKTLRPITIALAPGDCFIQYSDGIIEAMDDDSEEYGHHRTAGSLLIHSEKSLDDLINGMATDVRAFCNNDIGDDLTIFALRIREPEEVQEDDEAI